MDLFPTVLEIAGVGPNETSLDGRSFLATLRAESQRPLRDEIYFVRREGGPFGGKTIEALIRGEWKLVDNDPFGTAQLYHLAQDTLEQHDLSAAQPARLRDNASKVATSYSGRRQRSLASATRFSDGRETIMEQTARGQTARGQAMGGDRSHRDCVQLKISSRGCSF